MNKTASPSKQSPTVTTSRKATCCNFSNNYYGDQVCNLNSNNKALEAADKANR
ncbi:hypothetical protein PAHA111176_22405 [Parendozoicomonas haliclonae]|uniref:Uncharacterized protein n=1 Tax=Parendozoicomonas haliclonae TaxID=1960125 RepID=A0A1X7AR40_9GAMM|nr:hypothetical protein EHSB41UT_04593 [Parendozoicomonas haliclonae]